ncbi:MAG: hypothetical protein OXC02_01560 [Rhodobacteraceae bacterium]|nr:hypothetical protein [Paracoccaceae bacterium]
MALDVNAIREEFARLERTGGTIQLDRVPTREDIHARWHWDMTKLCEKKGFDAADWKVGRHSFLVGGVDQHEITAGEPPLEWRYRYDPMPLPWFDHPAGTDILVPIDTHHHFLHHLAGKHLAGWSNRPSGEDIYNMFVHEDYGPGDKLMMSELLADIRPQAYPQLRRWDALSIWHIARAAHTSQVRRGRLSWWLNRFAVKPLN